MKPLCLLLFLWLMPLRAEIVDRIAAVVGDRVIPRSAALAEARYQAFLSGQEPPPEDLDQASLEKIVSQLADQILLEQARAISPFAPSESEETYRRLEEIRKRFPSPQAYQNALARYRLTESEVRQRLSREIDLLAFIDFRLRPQVRLDPSQVESYYRETLLPELRRQGQRQEPPLAEVQGRIEEILAQREMNRLLEEWLKDLHSRTKVKTFH